ncbi:hypothetical protein N9809_04430 [Amylibacter sp.]|jgi:hypothetical protein|nr:hypothetical protein [Amylibacter sp.]|tara:strand:- start:172 stop:417 length:246 start_codon:yes stop_codon:yes gene_type:complete
MMTFKTYIKEAKHPTWVRLTVAALVIKMRNLSSRIESEKDPVIQNKLISQQNNLLSYITGLGIGVGTSDKLLLKRMKSYKR